MHKSVIVEATPSLALIKYWGKQDTAENLPATSSLALNLDGLTTKTEVSFAEADKVVINGAQADPSRYTAYFDRIRKTLHTDAKYLVKSESTFPTAAGLASSSSGFAALTLGCMALEQDHVDRAVASDLARFGSASAARAVYGGFTILPKGSRTASPLFSPDHWPELRVLIAIVKKDEKSVSSRKAMELARTTSPFYSKWVESSEQLYQDALEACRQKNLPLLGRAMQQSYLSMFSTMFTSVPPVMYWEPESIAIIQACDEMRKKGIQVWETMDAGPQVKMLCLDSDIEKIQQVLQRLNPTIEVLLSRPGGEAKIISREKR